MPFVVVPIPGFPRKWPYARRMRLIRKARRKLWSIYRRKYSRELTPNEEKQLQDPTIIKSLLSVSSQAKGTNVKYAPNISIQGSRDVASLVGGVPCPALKRIRKHPIYFYRSFSTADNFIKITANNADYTQHYFRKYLHYELEILRSLQNDL